MNLEKINYKICALALPALGSLLVEPLLTLVDSILAGWINTGALASLTLSSTFLNFLVGICIFLAYSTTAITGRLVGAGKNRQALEKGIQIFWLGIILGIILAISLFFLIEPLCYLYTSDPEIIGYTKIYFGISLSGLPAMLGYLAINGLMRGFANNKVPFYISLFAVIVNVPLSYLLSFPLKQGIAGIAWGTVIAQWLSLLIASRIINKQAGKYQANLGIDLLQIRTEGFSGLPLVLRSLFLQVSVALTVYVAGYNGKSALAGYQVVATIWTISAYALDAIAIAAQTIIAQALGKAQQKTPLSNPPGKDEQVNTSPAKARKNSLIYLLLSWGSLCGVVMGGLIIIGAAFIPSLFSLTDSTRYITVLALIAIGFMQPLAGLVYLIDGILIGAAQSWTLAKGYGLVLLGYAPILLLASLGIKYSSYGLVLVWLLYGLVFFGLRALVLLKPTIAIERKI